MVSILVGFSTLNLLNFLSSAGFFAGGAVLGQAMKRFYPFAPKGVPKAKKMIRVKSAKEIAVTVLIALATGGAGAAAASKLAAKEVAKKAAAQAAKKAAEKKAAQQAAKKQAERTAKKKAEASAKKKAEKEERRAYEKKKKRAMIEWEESRAGYKKKEGFLPLAGRKKEGKDPLRRLYDENGEKFSNQMEKVRKSSQDFKAKETKAGISVEFNKENVSIEHRYGTDISTVAEEKGLDLHGSDIANKEKEKLAEAVCDKIAREQGLEDVGYVRHGPHGIDKIYKDTDGDYVLVEVKYRESGSMTTSMLGSAKDLLGDKVKQMSDPWIEKKIEDLKNNENDPELAELGNELADARQEGRLKKNLVIVRGEEPTGGTIGKSLYTGHKNVQLDRIDVVYDSKVKK